MERNTKLQKKKSEYLLLTASYTVLSANYKFFKYKLKTNSPKNMQGLIPKIFTLSQG